MEKLLVGFGKEVWGGFSILEYIIIKFDLFLIFIIFSY